MSDLDRLLEGYGKLSNTDEWFNLKSQLESKLAEIPALQSINQALANRQVKLEDRISEIQSQHTNLVKAIQDKMKEWEKDHLDWHYPASIIYKELQNLLESTKES